jgi:hypothetical protein
MQADPIGGGDVQYKPVDGFQGYRVGSDGSVWTCRRGKSKIAEWRRMKPGVHRFGKANGYFRVSLARDGKSIQFPVHRLVLLAFRGPCPAGMIACHNNGDGFDNRLENLRWDTFKSNTEDSRTHGTMVRGEDQHLAKLTEPTIRAIKNLYAIERRNTIQDLARRYEISTTTVEKVLAQVTWKHVA